ncbi:hypothetical protein K402DRAFT_407233 [Aulographum hederae CBS 113979]|uniref:Cell cycle control protein cwf19 n=1 Tax=Aulographum hederae CBS 113979 TaxID=1176131 RepID=A0A6G1GPN7_9PEZI|nr:hypothetical protein K402DRAFT_407233 [Aulographum hederae CBS 113979]
MTLSDFERELAQEQAKDSRKKKRDRSRSRDRSHRHSKDSDRKRHRHHHSSRHDRDDDEESRHAHKRSRHERDDRGHRESKRTQKQEDGDEEDSNIGKGDANQLLGNDALADELEQPGKTILKRDAWMEEPSAFDVEYVRTRRNEDPKPTTTKSTKADYDLGRSKNELNHALHAAPEDEVPLDAVKEPAQNEVDYEIGDSGSSWRMTKLKGVYRMAKEAGKSVEDVALERYGNLRDFDDAREEEAELDRRDMYGEGYVGKAKPNGEFFQERKLNMGVHRETRVEDQADEKDLPQGKVVQDTRSAGSVPADQNMLNKLKAAMMKAKLRKNPSAAQLEADYNAAVASGTLPTSSTISLTAMDSRAATTRTGEVIALTNKRGLERGLVKENEEMSIDDMVRQEKRTRGHLGGEGQRFADRIAKDTHFDDDLDYMDENADKLAKHVQKSEVNLRNTAIEDYHKTKKALDNCHLCYHEDSNPPKPPVAPVISLATRTYLTLATSPELAPFSAVIVPLEHHRNLVEADDDEWTEVRNFQKALTRFYASLDPPCVPIFYENAARPRKQGHAAVFAVPVPEAKAEMAPAFFKEAILAEAGDWTQHKPVISTENKGKMGMRNSMPKEMGYFHVWFNVDGGLGHVLEDESRWPRGDLFAREVLGSVLGLESWEVKKQGKWEKGDKRIGPFRKKWEPFDWTSVLMDALIAAPA